MTIKHFPRGAQQGEAGKVLQSPPNMYSFPDRDMLLRGLAAAARVLSGVLHSLTRQKVRTDSQALSRYGQ